MCLYARDLDVNEGNKIQQILRHGKNAVYVRRCQVILASAQGMKVTEIAETYYLSEDHVRRLIRQFNKEGFASLKPKKPGGKEPTFTEEQQAEIIELALMPPKLLGLPFTQWSLHKLKDEAIKRKIVATISHEKIREIMKTARISHQRTKTWKESNDPELELKKNV
jgi:transposase